jgi:hypothetical protein
LALSLAMELSESGAPSPNRLLKNPVL